MSPAKRFWLYLAVLWLAVFALVVMVSHASAQELGSHLEWGDRPTMEVPR